MRNETTKNGLFGISIILLLISFIVTGKTIVLNLHFAERIYPSPGLSILLVSLMGSLGIAIFGLFILGDLNDFMLKRRVNLIGSEQKLQIVGEIY